MDKIGELNSINDIAIVGLAGRFPKAGCVNDYWKNLCEGLECISFFTDEELTASGVSPSILENPGYVKAQGILEDVDRFDATFFGFSPRESEIMDPQHRLFLECAWEAMENAGYDPSTYDGLIGVYAGSAMSTYLLRNLVSHEEMRNSVGRFQFLLGNDKDFMPTRVSHKLNLRGPSFSINSACSSSLVAVHIACQALLGYQCDMALAGGARIHIPQKEGYLYQKEGIWSPDGHCRAFDAKAAGFVRGSGVGIVVLRRLKDALADGDHIFAVIKGSAVNNDGADKVSYTAPGVEGQAQVVALAHALSGISPETITYVEAHGTGTALGDSIEIAALTQAFRLQTDRKSFCALGSVKTNIGHLDAAAGVAGLIKTALALEHKVIPPCLYFEQPNPDLHLSDTPFYVNPLLANWESNGGPLRAGVSSHGIGGTNAHVVLEEAPQTDRIAGSLRPWQLIVLSSRTAPSLGRAIGNLAKHLAENPNLDMTDVSYTLQVGRKAFKQRWMSVCKNQGHTVELLKKAMSSRQLTPSFPWAEKRPVVFMFPGQGAQYANMGMELYRKELVFRETVDECVRLVDKHIGFDFKEVLFPGQKELEAGRQLHQTYIAQLALFTIEYALAMMWKSWLGKPPQAMIGHSLGEYVAACLSGVFSLEDALSLVAVRGRLMQKMPAGRMLAVRLPEKELRSLLCLDLSIAAVNSPFLCVVSGTMSAVDAMHNKLAEQGIYCQALHTSHAFHSVMMDGVLDEFAVHLERLRLRPPRIPFISNVTGTWITSEEATRPAYWVSHLRRPVRFSDGAHELLKESEWLLLEVGPGKTLGQLVKDQQDTDGRIVLHSLPLPQQTRSDVEFTLNTLGQLWLSGVDVDWRAFHAGERCHRTPLPTYPFERMRYWIDPVQPREDIDIRHDSLSKKTHIADWFYVPYWKRSLPLDLAKHAESTKQRASWLIFADSCGLGSCMAEALCQIGHRAFTIIPGSDFKKTGDHAYTINPDCPEDYSRLLGELRATDKLPRKVVHLWGVSPEALNESCSGLAGKFQNMGFFSLVHLAQAIGDNYGAEVTHIGVVSSGMQDVTGGDALWPEKATMLGPCRVIPIEYPAVSCASIDCVSSDIAEGKSVLIVDQLIAEFTAGLRDPIVAYRNGHRWIRTYEAARIEASQSKSSALRERGIYLITGGLGGIGLVIAEYLARTVRARLVLIGRSDLPTRSDWERWLVTHGDSDLTSRRIEKLKLIEDLGAELLFVKADVSKIEQMRAAVAQTQQTFGEINGVIHSAGVASGRVIQLTSPEAAQAVFASKIEGTLILDSVLRDSKLDFFILFSSLASITGGYAQTAYCAANAFMDAFANSSSSKNNVPMVSVNWDSWKEIGMAVNTPLPSQLLERREERLREAILPEEGVEVFHRILPQLLKRREERLREAILSEEGVEVFHRILQLSGLLPQVIVSTRDLPALIEQERIMSTKSFAEGLDNHDSSRCRHQRPSLPYPYSPPETPVEESLCTIWEDLLGIEHVGVYDNFFDLGGHSLLATQLTSRVRALLDVDLRLRDVFLGPTIRSIAEQIERVRSSGANTWVTGNMNEEDEDASAAINYSLTDPLLTHE